MTLALLAVALLSLSPASAPSKPDAVIEGTISSDTLAPALAAVKAAPENSTISVLINSPGGDGFATLDFLSDARLAKAIRNVKVQCRVDWLAASAAFIILESDFCDDRQASQASVFLAHGVASMAAGKAGNVEDAAKLMRALDRAVAVLIAPRLHMTADEYLRWVDRTDRFLTYDELVAMGGLDVAPKSTPPVVVTPVNDAASQSPAPAPPGLAQRAKDLAADVAHAAGAWLKSLRPWMPSVLAGLVAFLMGVALARVEKTKQPLPVKVRAAGAAKRKRR